ncbi:putative SAM-dependent methyltransferase [Echria macrotheca]|uniref:SAM-dependent methyltransferase n=1 Tax=Echria macrotheca TaxID=438768 RepID=A0AAJ0BHX3_9PEZI|nr:putative SAM-dependent methyltransferase [Echria macrotheca]
MAVLPLSSATEIAAYESPPYTIPTNPADFPSHTEVSQTIHRINLLNAFGPTSFFPGARVLEIGCGQGTCTSVLAYAVSQQNSHHQGDHQGEGHVDAIDPAPLTYGAPITLGQAQGYLSAGPLGGNITFTQADPLSFLSSDTTKKWDTAVMAHCLWYFPSPSTLSEILEALKGRVKRVCLAEWALRVSHPSAGAHVLAALARGMLEATRRHGRSDENIQTPMSPATMRDVAEQAGWAVEAEEMVVPDAALDDGRWEVGTVISTRFVDDVAKEVGGNDERLGALLRSAREATVAATEAVGGLKKVTSMDVWVATLVAK